MSEAINEVKSVFREIMLHILECEDEIILEIREPRLKEVVRRHFENLRTQLSKVYVRKLRERYEREVEALTKRLDVAFMPSKLIAKPPRGSDKAKTWMERLSDILDDYEGALKQLKKRAGSRRAW